MLLFISRASDIQMLIPVWMGLLFFTICQSRGERVSEGCSSCVIAMGFQERSRHLPAETTFDLDGDYHGSE